MPADSAEVTVRLFNFKHQVTSSLTHKVAPNDILIRNLDRTPVPPHRYLHQSGPAADKLMWP